MSVKGPALLLAAGLGLGACSGAWMEIGTRDQTAEIAVLAYVGLSRGAERPSPAPIVLVADMTSLVREGGEIEASWGAQLALARAWAADLLPRGAGPQSISLLPFDRLGVRSPSPCASGRGPWAAAALEQLRSRIDADVPAPRVVLIADIAQECEVDLCRAGRKLVGAGAWLDVVSLGPAEEPACLQALRPDGSNPGSSVRQATAVPPRFRVEGLGPGARESTLLARGLADGTPVRVAAGTVRVVVELDGEESVGPFAVEPGDRVRVRLQSFPSSGRGARWWTVDTVDRGSRVP